MTWSVLWFVAVRNATYVFPRKQIELGRSRGDPAGRRGLPQFTPEGRRIGDFGPLTTARARSRLRRPRASSAHATPLASVVTDARRRGFRPRMPSSAPAAPIVRQKPFSAPIPSPVALRRLAKCPALRTAQLPAPGGEKTADSVLPTHSADVPGTAQGLPRPCRSARTARNPARTVPLGGFLNRSPPTIDRRLRKRAFPIRFAMDRCPRTRKYATLLIHCRRSSPPRHRDRLRYLWNLR